MGYRVAVVGATGNVGREILNILSERDFPADEVIAVASARSKGRQVSYGDGEVLDVRSLDDFDFGGIDLALFSPGAKVSAIHAPRAAETGCVVIDNTSHFRMEPAVPLIVPEVNIDALGDFRETNIIANPNCSTIQMVVALKPLHDLAHIKRVVVSTYQSVSGAGKAAMDELFDQTRKVYSNEMTAPKHFPRRIAFNVVPQIDGFLSDGSTKEEQKMANETRKILDPEIAVTATCVRVPVFVGHAEAINVEFETPLMVEEAREALRDAPGVLVVDDPEEGQFITPIECVGDFAVFVSRIRADDTVPYGLNLWVVSDNLRKGAAWNAVQIAEELTRQYM